MYACKHRETDLCYTEIFKSQLQYAASLLHQNELIILLNKKFPGRDHIPLMCIWPFHKIKTGKLHFAAHLTQHMKVSVAQSCLTLCDPMECGPAGSSVNGILQSRILEWVTIPFSRRSSRPRDQTQVSHISGRFFTIWANGETKHFCAYKQILSKLPVATWVFKVSSALRELKKNTLSHSSLYTVTLICIYRICWFMLVYL